MANQEERNRQMQQIIAKCWSDEAFKEKLVADPHATLAAEGVEIPEGVNISVLSNTADIFHLVIPAIPDDVELSDEDLETLMEATRLSASSYGLQPYHVLVISDQGIKEQLKPASWNQSQLTDASHIIVFANKTDFGE